MSGTLESMQILPPIVTIITIVEACENFSFWVKCYCNFNLELNYDGEKGTILGTHFQLCHQNASIWKYALNTMVTTEVDAH